MPAILDAKQEKDSMSIAETETVIRDFITSAVTLPNLSDEWFLSHYRNGLKLVLATGEYDICLNDNLRVSGMMHAKQIPHWLDVWGDGTGHDLVRCAVAAEGIDRDTNLHGPSRYGAGARCGEISRPRYVLHVGQTRCGRLG